MTKVHLRNQSGSAFVELALVLPLFALLLVGAAELGRLAYFAVQVEAAARAGAAYGSQNHATASDTAGMKAAASQNVSLDVSSLKVSAGPCLCPASAAIAAVPACTGNFISGTGAVSYPFASCPDVSSTNVYVQVNTRAVVNTIFHYPGFPASYTLNGTATMVVAQ